MGTALITLRIMPESPEVNLEELRKLVQEKIESGNGKEVRFEEQPVAFGLKALMTSFSQDEEESLDSVQDAINSLEEVSSAEVSDMRRAFG